MAAKSHFIHVSRAAPSAFKRPSVADIAQIVVAVAAVSTAAPLIRAAAAPALSVALWRNAFGAGAVVPFAVAGARRRVPVAGRERRLSVAAGVLLAAHFATWIPSLSFTSIASSVALVATQPVWAGVLARCRGDDVPRLAWVGICLAVGGTVVLTGVDVAVSGRALVGDGLALLGGALAAAYVTVGAEVRRTVTTARYTALCYSTAAVVLLVVCLVGRAPVIGFPARTWLYFVALAAGPQLLGHSVFNRVLRTTSPTVVSVAVLFEVVGATLIARLAFGETPPVGVLPAAGLIVVGVAVVILAGRPAAAAVD